MVIGVMSSYLLLDKRVGVLEERNNTAIAQAADKQAEQKSPCWRSSPTSRDLQRSVNEISRAVAGKRP